MSYTMWSIDCVALRINEDYLKALEEDAIAYVTGKINLSEDKQDKLFKHLLDTLENNDLEDLDTFAQNYCDDIRRFDKNNYARACKIDFKTGTLSGLDDFNGYAFPISFGSNSIYQPEFKDSEELVEGVKEIFYIPKHFKIEDNLLFITGVEEG